jgi:hypothetical protein
MSRYSPSRVHWNDVARGAHTPHACPGDLLREVKRTLATLEGSDILVEAAVQVSSQVVGNGKSCYSRQWAFVKASRLWTMFTWRVSRPLSERLVLAARAPCMGSPSPCHGPLTCRSRSWVAEPLRKENLQSVLGHLWGFGRHMASRLFSHVLSVLVVRGPNALEPR